MTISKKEKESRRLARFASLIADFPNGSVDQTEEPDFLIRRGDRVVGVELTDLYRETPAGQVSQQARESVRNQVIAMAQTIYDSLSFPPVYATFFLDDCVNIKNSEVELLAKQLAELVLLNLPDSNSSIEIPSYFDIAPSLPSILRLLRVRRLDSITESFFSNPGATWVGALNQIDIERTLKSKESKLMNYKAKCQEVWLVINVDIESMATWFQVDAGLLQIDFFTNFDRVYLVQHFRGIAHRLRVKEYCT